MSNEELAKKRKELINRYTELYSEGKEHTEECRTVVAERLMIERLLGIKYYKIK